MSQFFTAGAKRKSSSTSDDNGDDKAPEIQNITKTISDSSTKKLCAFCHCRICKCVSKGSNNKKQKTSPSNSGKNAFFKWKHFKNKK